jgi:uncharacterized protein YndB with AHSA1/START domain
MMLKYQLFILSNLLFQMLFSQSDTNFSIKWPEAYQPENSRFYVHNEIEINASPEKVWSVLINALRWESWYEGARNVKMLDSSDLSLNKGSKFSWETMGLSFVSEIKALENNHYLAWESKKKSIQGYHAWLIVPTDSGCRVITDESQNGWLTFFEKIFQGKKLQYLHEVWLKELKKISEAKI